MSNLELVADRMQVRAVGRRVGIRTHVRRERDGELYDGTEESGETATHG